MENDVFLKTAWKTVRLRLGGPTETAASHLNERVKAISKDAQTLSPNDALRQNAPPRSGLLKVRGQTQACRCRRSVEGGGTRSAEAERACEGRRSGGGGIQAPNRNGALPSVQGEGASGSRAPPSLPIARTWGRSRADTLPGGPLLSSVRLQVRIKRAGVIPSCDRPRRYLDAAAPQKRHLRGLRDARDGHDRLQVRALSRPWRGA